MAKPNEPVPQRNVGVGASVSVSVSVSARFDQMLRHNHDALEQLLNRGAAPTVATPPAADSEAKQHPAVAGSVAGKPFTVRPSR